MLIRADKQTRYDFMRAVMVAVAQAKIGNVTFSVVDKEAPVKQVKRPSNPSFSKTLWLAP